jgi:hypothetical protein
MNPFANNHQRRIESMAIFETELNIAAPLAETFAYVSDFSNAPSWDPRTYAAEKTTDGPIGIGTRFILTGGMLPKGFLTRLRIPVSLAGMPLPYDVVHYDAPRTFTLRGESAILRWEDILEFSSDGENTRLRYFARLELKGLLVMGEPFLRLLFRRIGVDATSDIPAVVQEQLGRGQGN